MKSFSIKVGKAWNVIRRDGVIAGMKRNLDAFFKLFRCVKAGDILFITNGVGDSARYRTKHVGEELERNGFRVGITVQDNPFLNTYVKQFSVFVFHRTLYTSRIRTLMEKIKAAGKTIVFETDDLTYDGAYIRYMAGLEKMNALEKELYRNGLSAEIVNDPYVKAATTTTPYLAKKLLEKGKTVYLVRNKMSEEDRLLCERLVQEPKVSDGLIRIGYFSGSASHNKDFATITDPLLQILRKYDHVRLVLVGPLDISPELEDLGDRVERRTFVPWEEHFRLIREMDICLAPLEVGNPFCEAKSELKFFEAGLVEVPTVASATETFREAISDGMDGYVALSHDEWREKLERLVLDQAFRIAMGKRARETAEQKYTTKNGKSPEYYNFLRSKIV